MSSEIKDYTGGEARYAKKLIPNDLWKQVRGAALLDNKKLGEWIEEAFREKLSRGKNENR